MGKRESEKTRWTELNEILLHIMPHIWIRQACVRVFYFEAATFKKAINIFDFI